MEKGNNMPKKIRRRVDERKREKRWLIGGDFNAQNKRRGWIRELRNRDKAEVIE